MKIDKLELSECFIDKCNCLNKEHYIVGTDCNVNRKFDNWRFSIVTVHFQDQPVSRV